MENLVKAIFGVNAAVAASIAIIMLTSSFSYRPNAVVS